MIVNDLGVADYPKVLQQMQAFTNQRDSHTPDELWLVEHPAVFTQGTAGKAEHILNAHDIPIIQSDRGGQVTYHGPGQIVAYTLIDVRRAKLTVRDLVVLLEDAVIALLNDYAIHAYARRDAPGVYVNDAKICSLGLRIRRGYSYHGLALNVAMDLTPFHYINPCGYANMAVTQLHDLINHKPDIESIKNQLVAKLTLLLQKKS
jgi:lipoyl(octanoyl) transferase